MGRGSFHRDVLGGASGYLNWTAFHFSPKRVSPSISVNTLTCEFGITRHPHEGGDGPERGTKLGATARKPWGKGSSGVLGGSNVGARDGCSREEVGRDTVSCPSALQEARVSDDETTDARRRLDSPNPNRLGSPGWLVATGGRLTREQRGSMFVKSVATQFELFLQKIARRRSVRIDVESIMTLPDSRLVLEAREAALCQSSALLAHGYRTAVFARALAQIDEAEVDDEQLVVCALLHDAGLVPSVVGEDFTLRSARIAEDAARRAAQEAIAPRLRDAICVHTTIGIDVEKDGALGAYTQFGAMVDLVGLRERHLPYELVSRVVDQYPREGFTTEILAALGAEARAVPGGRFAFLRRVGFAPAVRLSSVPSRR